jgi:hypothetical protein
MSNIQIPHEEPVETPPPGRWSWSIVLGVVLILLAVALPIIDGFLPTTAVSVQVLDTAVTLMFGAAAVLLGVGVGDQAHPFSQARSRSKGGGGSHV